MIIGGGFGGLLAAARLQEVGITDTRIIEKAGDFGGTWYWNRYPGAQCDIESYVYLPLLEETGYIPKEKYSFAPEIFEHAQRIGKHFNLYKHACFQTQVKEARWDDGAGRWTVKTDRGDVFQARFVVMSSGPLNRPKLPAIPGIENFKGHTFHTSRWDYDYTGGDTTGGLHKLARQERGHHRDRGDRHSVRVASRPAREAALRLSAHALLGGRARQQADRSGMGEDALARMAGLSEPQLLLHLGRDPHHGRSGRRQVDEPFQESRKLLAGEGSEPLRRGDGAHVGDRRLPEDERDSRSRRHHRKDRATAEALKPWYGQWCKRPTFNDEYLPTFNRPNVKLVDTNGKGVERMTENALVVNGVEYEVDCVIFATGFEVGTAYTRRAEFEVYGRGGVSLSSYWANGMKTHYGFLSHGFPNLFHMGLTQTGLAPNFTYMLGGQATHIAHVMAEMKAREAKSVEPTPEAEAEWVERVTGKTFMTAYQSTCTPGYYNGEGKGQGFLETQDPDGAVRFYEMLARWREKGDLEGLIVK